MGSGIIKTKIVLTGKKLTGWLYKSRVIPIISAALILVVITWAVAYWMVSNERESWAEHSRREARHLSSVFEHQTLQTLGYADTYLKIIRREFSKGGLEAARRMIEDLPPELPVISHITVIDRTGKPILVSGHSIKPGTTARDREYFKVQKQQAGDKIYFSLPIKGRNSGLLTVRMVRRLETPGGDFNGVIFAAIKADNLTSFFNKLNLGPKSSATLVGTDKKIRARSSYGRLGPGQDFSGSRIWKELEASPVGLYRQTSVVDDITRYYAYRKFEDYPLIAAIGVATEDIIADVQQFSLQIYAIAGLLSLVVLVMSLLLYREIQAGHNLVRARFLTNMSHELRTPMNAILGFAQMLEVNSEEPLTQKQKNAVNRILKSGNHLLDLIDQVLELNKIEAGKLSLNMDYTSAGEVIDESIFLISARAKNDGIKIIDQTAEVDLPLLWTDSTRLAQVLLNLLSNAVKYNRDGGTVTISHQFMSDRILRILIADTGEGIPVEKQGDLFKLFERLGREVGDIEGTGIGLTIAKQIIELMGGQIGFKSSPGKGSTFWIDVPVSELQPELVKESRDSKEMEQEPDRTDDSGPPRKILYIEDNPENMRLMESIIEKIDNTSLLTAFNAELGLDLALREKPELILMDINLPGMSGLDALRELLDAGQTNHIPVVALTSAALPKEVEAGLQAGFSDYVTKPFDVPRLIKLIEEYLLRSAES